MNRQCTNGNGCLLGFVARARPSLSEMLSTRLPLLLSLPRRAFSSSAIEPVVQKLLAEDKPSRGLVDQLSSLLPPTPVSLVALLKQAELSHNRPETNLLAGRFVRRELQARRAYGLSMVLKAEVDGGPALRTFLSDKMIQELKNTYWERLRSLLDNPRMDTSADEEKFYEAVRKDNTAQEGETRKACARALAHQSGETGSEQLRHEQLEVTSFLDSFFSQRIGLRFLIEHYLASRQPRDGFAGLIQHECSPTALMAQLGAAMEERTRALFGTSPRILLHGDRAQTFAYLPANIEFVVGELLDNACKATVRHHGGLLDENGKVRSNVIAAGDYASGRQAELAHELPPVKVIAQVLHTPLKQCPSSICCRALSALMDPFTLRVLQVVVASSDEHVYIKVADLGGGIPRCLTQLHSIPHAIYIHCTFHSSSYACI